MTNINKLLAAKVLMGIMLIPCAHTHALNEAKFRTQFEETIKSNEILFTTFSEVVVSTSSEFEEQFGNIAVAAETAVEAKCKRQRIIM